MIDPVRFLSNRSSGKMGFALARAAAVRGANVMLVAGPTNVERPLGIEVRNVISAEQMREGILEALPSQQVLIMAAAVADYAPLNPVLQKLKKEPDKLSLELRRTPDILTEVGQTRAKGQIIVGFAAETENVVENARQKLFTKNLDLIVANDVSAPDLGFESDTITATMIWPDGKVRELELVPKTELADAVLTAVLALLAEKR